MIALQTAATLGLLGHLSIAGAQIPAAGRALTASHRAPPQATAVAPLAFTGVTVVDVVTGQTLADRTVLIVGNRIHALGPTGAVRVPARAHRIDARGKYLIPGLWDMHEHNANTRLLANAYESFLVTGVTGVRDMLSGVPRDTVRRWWREVETGTRIGPRILSAGYLRSGTPANADSLPPDKLRGFRRLDAGIVVVNTPAAARQAVDSFAAAGVDFIKIHDDQLAPELFFAIAAEARQRGLPLVGHWTQRVPMAVAADSGQRSFEHASMWTASPCWRSDSVGDRACAALVATLVRHGSWLTPTLQNGIGLDAPDSVYRAGWAASIAPDSAWASGGPGAVLWFVHHLHQLGAPLLAGTDIAFPDLENLSLDLGHLRSGMTVVDLVPQPGRLAPIYRELVLLVAAGLTPLEALQTATLNPAKYLQATDSLGIVAPGQLADLVLLDANPLLDIHNIMTVHAVVANGRYFSPAALAAVVAETKRRIVAWVPGEMSP